MAARHLQQELKRVQKDPVHGCCIQVDEDDLFKWTVFIEGPKDSPYEGGIFRTELRFPQDFPMNPPAMRFVSDFWHPNVYDDGRLCISILHPPGDDEMSGETAFERWLPIQTVETVLLSVLSLLGEPNTSSPANVDASVQWRKDRKGFVERCRKLVDKAKRELPAGVVIPHPDTNKDDRPAQQQPATSMYDDDYYYNDYYQDDDDDDEDGGSQHSDADMKD